MAMKAEAENVYLLNDLLFDNSNAINGKLFGNHAVVALDIEEGNYTLVVDPTNYLIVGILKNGKIYKFDDGFIYDYKIITSSVFENDFDDITWRELMKLYSDESILEVANSAVRKRELHNSNK